ALFSIVFFFQAEDGIRDRTVTGVQTCALPICDDHLAIGGGHGERRHLRVGNSGEDVLQNGGARPAPAPLPSRQVRPASAFGVAEIGRASCRERVEISGGEGQCQRKQQSYCSAV